MKGAAIIARKPDRKRGQMGTGLEVDQSRLGFSTTKGTKDTKRLNYPGTSVQTANNAKLFN
jgi:hypothetical protein